MIVLRDCGLWLDRWVVVKARRFMHEVWEMAAAGVACPAFGPRFTDPSRLIVFSMVSSRPPTSDGTTLIYYFMLLMIASKFSSGSSIVLNK